MCGRELDGVGSRGAGELDGVGSRGAGELDGEGAEARLVLRDINHVQRRVGVLITWVNFNGFSGTFGVRRLCRDFQYSTVI